jgi:glycosyltransferase involved in cell wall biosynthesis
MTSSTPSSPAATTATVAVPAPLNGAASESERTPEISVVMPCLNEADTIAVCIEKAQAAMREHNIVGEIVIADNGSTDASKEIAEGLGARVVPVPLKGYGNALMGGIAAARGKYVVMGDADDSYDFREVPRFLEKLREGNDLVQGCRLPSGGGTVMPGAMPWLHRWWGNPMFSYLVRKWFRAPIHDVNCGLRGFSKALYERLDQRCTGMEFATEMIIKASLSGEKIAEVPITLHPDGRKAHGPHLRTFRDGWRTLRFYLMCSPRWMFLMPGLLLVLFGLIGFGVAMPNLTLGGIKFGEHTLLFSSLAILCGYQAILFAVLSKTFAIGEGLIPSDGRMESLWKAINLEKGLVVGALALVVGLGLLLATFGQWSSGGFGELNYARTMRWAIPGSTLTALGFQTILFSFFLSLLGLRRK